jgi:RND superfamily putative drug exporter
MLDWLGRLAVQARHGVLIVTLVLVAGAGLLASGTGDRLATGGFSDPQSESAQASQLRLDHSHVGDPNLVLVVTAPAGSTVDDASSVRSGKALTERLRTETGVAEVTSYWGDTAAPQLRSSDGRSALVLVRVSGDEDAVKKAIGTFIDDYQGEGNLTIKAAGSAEVSREMTENLEKDLVHAESIAFPLTLLLLLLVFASLVAAGLPLVIGGVAVSGTMALLWVLAGFTDVSVFALNVTTALGLGLAIDYSLFVVTRFREELAKGLPVHDAVRDTVRTAGRTVVFSAATVALSLAALLVFPLYFLRSIAYAGIAVVVLAALSAVLVLPSVLAVLGHRVDSLGLRRRRAQPRRALRPPPFWHRLALRVMKRPLLPLAGVTTVLVVLGLPFLGGQFGLPDDRVLPAEATSHQAGDMLRNDFDSFETAQLFVVSADHIDAPAVDAYARKLSTLDDVDLVDASTGTYRDGAKVAPPTALSARHAAGEGTWLSVVPESDAYSAASQELVHEIRDTSSPVMMLVGGQSATLVDTQGSIAHRLPLALGIVAVLVGTLLFLFTGSVLVPLKAPVLNALSLSATFGAMVWVFQEGHLKGLFGDFTVTGQLDTTMPILMFCVAFGLSMDYEVFLLSRIQEEWRATGDNTAAIAAGLGKTGKLVTAAATLVAVVFLCFSTSGVTSLKMLGVGLALAVLVDATLVRGLLVPAVMGLTGRANWWAPAPLRALHRRFGLSEAGPQVDPPPTGTPRPSAHAHGAGVMRPTPAVDG